MRFAILQMGMPRFLKLFSGSASNSRHSTTIDQWAIGILRGPSLDKLYPSNSPRNPVLTVSDVTDRRAGFIADPFMIQRDGVWYLFFETFDLSTERGVIGLATSTDTKKWDYCGTALEEPFHLSYPQVFEHDGRIYMIPETKKIREVRLYEATDFPKKWRYVTTLLKGRFADSSVVFFQNRWWIFSTQGAYSLAIFYSDTLTGPWKRHLIPIILFHNRQKARPGGRIVTWNGKLIRFAQDNEKYYGHQLRAFRIDTLTPYRYSEEEISPSPFLDPFKTGWPCNATHQIDPHQIEDGSWIAAIDGAMVIKD